MKKGGEPMKLLTRDEILQPGNMWMLYGATEVGKTTSMLQTADCPIKYIQTEPRSLKPSIDAANRSDLDLDVVVPESFMDLLGYLSDLTNFEKYPTICFDSLSFTSNVDLSSEIEDEIFESLKDDQKKRKPLINRTKLSLEGYGGLSSNLFRLTRALGKISQQGKLVIITCLLTSSPSWNRELVAAPALKGKEYPDSMPGFFDMIGLVESRVKDGKFIYPPMVHFKSLDGSFLAKHTGVSTKTSGPLDIARIMEINNK
jgi:hypothetical protein